MLSSEACAYPFKLRSCVDNEFLQDCWRFWRQRCFGRKLCNKEREREQDVRRRKLRRQERNGHCDRHCDGHEGKDGRYRRRNRRRGRAYCYKGR